MSSCLIRLFLSVFVFALSLPLTAAELKATARESAERWKKAVINVKLVAKVKLPNREEDQKLEVTGTVIDPSGLTVVSAQSIDPAALIRTFFNSVSPGQGQNFKFESEVRETALILDDGTEVEADVVLKDSDLDLAFVRPRESTRTYEFIPLKPPMAPPDLLEDVFVISRLGRSENRSISISTGLVQAIVKGPRPFYVCNDELSAGSVGTIAFNAGGATLGVFVLKPKQNTGDGGMGALMTMVTGGRGGAGSTVILRPVQDLIEVAAQAKEAKLPDKTPQTQTAPAAPPQR